MIYPLCIIALAMLFFLPPIKHALEKIGAELQRLRAIAEENQRYNLKR